MSYLSVLSRMRDDILNRRSVQISIFVSILVLSFALFWFGRTRLDADDCLRHGYFGVFTVNLLTCATVLIPVPGEAVNVAAGSSLGPLYVARVGTIGATIGEMMSYVTGCLGRTVLLNKYSAANADAERWMNRHGVLAVFLFALVPMLIYDLIGIVAVAARYHIAPFMAATFAGRFFRCLIEAYLGYSVVGLLPLP